MMQADSPINTVNLNLGAKSYPIHIGRGILPDLGVHVRALGLGNTLLVVTNPTVRELYGRTVTETLRQAGFAVIIGEVPDGEQYKTLESASLLYDIAFNNALDRDCAVVALGGGVIGDLAGFVAATYMRGLPFIQVPTTLLAQVDSSVGGKVAVNHPRGKNIIGAFYQPRMVFADVDVLRTLEERQLRAGMAEVLKYGVIWDSSFFNFLEENADKIMSLEFAALARVIGTSCTIKAAVVEQDETEQSIRAILNYGHTFGHAYEALTGYKKYVHGEAVAIGMVSAAMAAVRLGLLAEAEAERIGRVIKIFGLPTDFGDLKPADIIASMQHDKKVQAGRIRFILPEGIGRVRITADVPEQVLVEVLSSQ